MVLNQSVSTASPQLSRRRMGDLLQHLAEFMNGKSNASLLHC
jgi:hypothetical protein